MNLSGSGRGGVSSEGYAGAGMRFSRKRQTPFFPRKEKRMIPCMWVLHIYPAHNDSLCIGEILDKSSGFTVLIALPPLFPTIKNNHILQMSVEYGSSEATFFGEPGVSSVRFL